MIVVGVLVMLVAFSVAASANTSTNANASPGDQVQPEAEAERKMNALRAMRDAVECNRVVERVSSLLVDPELTPEQKREVQWTNGECLVVIGNIREASEIFKAVFHEDPDAKVTIEDVEPRVTILIEAARSEVKALRDAQRAEARAKLIERIHLDVIEPAALKGGSRALFNVTLVDPDGAVRSMRLDFRKEGDPEFYALPVTKLSDGKWRGEVPGSYTRTSSGVVLEWYVTASDDQNERLKSVGDRASPNRLTILPGSIIASDLRANERISQQGRIASGIVLTPVLSGIGAVLGLTAGGTVLLASIFVDDGLKENVNIAGVILMCVLPTVGTGFGAAFVNNEVLDAPDALWATAIPTAIAGVGSVIGVGAITYSLATGNGNIIGAFGAQIVIGAVAVLSTSVVTPVFVVLDPPEE